MDIIIRFPAHDIFIAEASTAFARQGK